MENSPQVSRCGKLFRSEPLWWPPWVSRCGELSMTELLWWALHEWAVVVSSPQVNRCGELSMSELLWQPPQEQSYLAHSNCIVVLLFWALMGIWAWILLCLVCRRQGCGLFGIHLSRASDLNICVNSEIAQMFVFQHQTPKPWKQIKFGM